MKQMSLKSNGADADCTKPLIAMLMVYFRMQDAMPMDPRRNERLNISGTSKFEQSECPSPYSIEDVQVRGAELSLYTHRPAGRLRFAQPARPAASGHRRFFFKFCER